MSITPITDTWHVEETTEPDNDGGFFYAIVDTHGTLVARQVVAVDADKLAAAPVMADTLHRLWALALKQPTFTGFCDEVVVQCRTALSEIEVPR